MSEEYLGQEHAKFLRSLANGIESGISRERHFLNAIRSANKTKQLEELEKEIAPALRGSALVTFIAVVEYLVGKNADGSWNIPTTWYGKEEFNNLRIIRHCWAHAAGVVLSNRRTELVDYLQRLQNSEILDREGQVVAKYFFIETNKVFLTGLNRVRVLCLELLAEKGLVIKWWEQQNET